MARVLDHRSSRGEYLHEAGSIYSKAFGHGGVNDARSIHGPRAATNSKGDV